MISRTVAQVNKQTLGASCLLIGESTKNIFLNRGFRYITLRDFSAFDVNLTAKVTISIVK